jgi:hypothetical protein
VAAVERRVCPIAAAKERPKAIMLNLLTIIGAGRRRSSYWNSHVPPKALNPKAVWVFPCMQDIVIVSVSCKSPLVEHYSMDLKHMKQL